MKRNFLGSLIGAVMGGITFYPLAMPISLTIMLNMGIDSNMNDLGKVEVLFWLIPLVGAVIGGLVGGYIGNKKSSFTLFKNVPVSIILWSITLFGVFGLDLGAWFSGVTLIGLGNTSTAIDLWIFSGMAMIIGVIAGAGIGFLIALIRFAITRYYGFSSQAQ